MTQEFVDPVGYKTEREQDWQYHELLQRILDEGARAQSGMDEESKQVLGHLMRFDLRNGFPMITERDLMVSMKVDPSEYEPDTSERPFRFAAKQGLGEIIGFINGARTIEQLEGYGNKWWNMWATEDKCVKRGLEPGDLGPGSYGAAFHDYPDPVTGKPYNQFEQVLKQIEERPELRTHIIDPYIPPYIIRNSERTQQVVVVPCHGELRFDIDVENNEFTLVHKQRSADTPVGLPFNMIHYGALMLMFSRVTGYRPAELVYFVDNAHIYKRHYDKVEEILARDPKPFPLVRINPEVQQLFDFRVEDFTVSDYDAHPPINMGGTPV